MLMGCFPGEQKIQDSQSLNWPHVSALPVNRIQTAGGSATGIVSGRAAA
jgi:hypothetical protein